MLIMDSQPSSILYCSTVLTRFSANTFQKAAEDLITIDQKLSAVEIQASSRNNSVIPTILLFFLRFSVRVCVAVVYFISCPLFRENCLTNEANPFFTDHSGQKSQSGGSGLFMF